MQSKTVHVASIAKCSQGVLQLRLIRGTTAQSGRFNLSLFQKMIIQRVIFSDIHFNAQKSVCLLTRNLFEISLSLLKLY